MAQRLRTISKAIVFQVHFMAASLAITLILSRNLGLEEFGRYSWLTGIAFLLAGLSQAGGNSLVVRETSRSSSKRAPLVILARIIMVSGGALVALTLVALFFAGEELTRAHLLPLLMMAGTHLSLVLLGASIRGIGLIEKGQIPELMLRPTLFLVMVGLVFLLGWEPRAEEIIYLQVAANLSVILVAVWILLSGLRKRPSQPDETIEPGWLPSFFRLGIVGWLAVGSAQLLIILTGALADFTEVGLFRVGSQVALVMGLGYAAFEAIQAPALARAFKENDFHAMHSLLQQSCRIGLLISAVMMVVLLTAGRPLLGFMFGNEYVAAYLVVCVLAGAQLINATTGNVGNLMIAAKLEGKLIYGNALALLITIFSAALFIPEHGAMAAAFAGSLGLVVRNVMCAWFSWRDLGIIALPFAPFPARVDAREFP